MSQDPEAGEATGQLSVSDLSTLCGETIRVQLDWLALEKVGGTVRTMVLSNLGELSSFVFPWYILRGKGETTWRNPDGHALRVDDLPECLRDLRPARQKAVLDLARDFGRLREPLLMILAAYRLSSGCRLLLDGNHRVAALRVHPVPFRALLTELDGPIDRRILPDLARHGG